jgi:hypothetical protein
LILDDPDISEKKPRSQEGDCGATGFSFFLGGKKEVLNVL